jgi:acetoin utilization deacetylase AcuC-like enzyme
MTLPGHRALVRRTIDLADELTRGRIVACGGGGYAWATVVPRAWTALAAELAEADVAEEIPEAWRERVRGLGVEPPATLSGDVPPLTDPMMKALVLGETQRTIEKLRAPY